MDSKKDMWLIHASVDREYKVVFDKKITALEAKDRFLEKDYEDIIDENDVGICYVISTE